MRLWRHIVKGGKKVKNKQAKKAIKKALKEKHILPWGAYREAKNIYQQEYAYALESHADPSEAEGLATRKAIEAIEKRPSWNKLDPVIRTV